MADITQRATELRAKLEKDREVHQANLQATLGAIQAIDLLLAPEPVVAGAADTPTPEGE